MMFVKASCGPQGPRIRILGSDWRIAEISTDLSAMGGAHVLEHETDYRSCLTIDMQDGRKREEAKAKQ